MYFEVIMHSTARFHNSENITFAFMIDIYTNVVNLEGFRCGKTFKKTNIMELLHAKRREIANCSNVLIVIWI